MSESFPIDCFTPLNDCLTKLFLELSIDGPWIDLLLMLSVIGFWLIEFPRFFDNFNKGYFFSGIVGGLLKADDDFIESNVMGFYDSSL